MTFPQRLNNQFLPNFLKGFPQKKPTYWGGRVVGFPKERRGFEKPVFKEWGNFSPFPNFKKRGVS